jgi:hypothetical protein
MTQFARAKFPSRHPFHPACSSDLKNFHNFSTVSFRSLCVTFCRAAAEQECGDKCFSFIGCALTSPMLLYAPSSSLFHAETLPDEKGD